MLQAESLAGNEDSVAGLCQLPGLHGPSPRTWSAVLRGPEGQCSECVSMNGPCESPPLVTGHPAFNNVDYLL